MAFKNFDKPDKEKVEKIEKPNVKDAGEKEKVADRVKGFLDKMKAAKEGKEGKEGSKEGKENKESKENKEKQGDKKGEKKMDNPWALSPEQLKKYNEDTAKDRERAKKKMDAGNNNTEGENRGERVRERRQNRDDEER